MAKVYLYTDRYRADSILAAGLKAELMSAGGFEVEYLPCGTTDLPARLRADRPDIVLLDLTAAALLGTLGDIRRGATGCHVVLLVDAIATEWAFQAMRLGVRGILRKSLPADLVVQGLKRVQRGELLFEGILTGAAALVASRRNGKPAEKLRNFEPPIQYNDVWRPSCKTCAIPSARC